MQIQNGQVPLLPNYDGLSVDAARSLRVIEYVFMQVPYIVRAKVLHECEKLSSGLHIDLDAFLMAIVDQWKEESGRAEERLRALFVASDLDGDGNLDFSEFTSIINNLRGGKGHREMLRMYAEMTLNQQVRKCPSEHVLVTATFQPLSSLHCRILNIQILRLIATLSCEYAESIASSHSRYFPQTKPPHAHPGVGVPHQSATARNLESKSHVGFAGGTACEKGGSCCQGNLRHIRGRVGQI